MKRVFTDAAIDRGLYALLPAIHRDVLLHVEAQHPHRGGSEVRFISLDFAALVTRLTPHTVRATLLDLARQGLLAAVLVVRGGEQFAIVAPTEHEALVGVDEFLIQSRRRKRRRAAA